MKLFRFLILIFFIFVFNYVNAQEKNLQSKITKNLRCLVCQGQSVYDSDSDFANSLKILVADKLKKGNSEKQIYSFLEEKYGEWILYDPKFDKSTYFLWLLPILMFLIGGAIILRIFIFKKN